MRNRGPMVVRTRLAMPGNQSEIARSRKPDVRACRCRWLVAVRGSSGGLAALGDEAERDAVVAVALPGRLGAVIEDVAVVAAAAAAVVLGARHPDLDIGRGAQPAGDRGEEAWPAGAAVKLHRRGEQRQAAPRA